MDSRPQSSMTCFNPWGTHKKSTHLVKSATLILVDDKEEFGRLYPNLIGRFVCAYCLKKPSGLSGKSSMDETLPAESSNSPEKATSSGSQNPKDSSENQAQSIPEPAHRKSCCNPFQKHTKMVKADLRSLSEHLKKKAAQNKLLIREHDLVCSLCRKNISALPDVCSQSSEDSPASSQTSCLSTGLSPTVLKEDAKNFILKLSGTEFNLSGYRDSEKVDCAKRKLEEINDVVKKKLCLALEIPFDKVHSLRGDQQVREDMESFMMSIKNKLPSLRYQEQIQLLTAAPLSLSERKAAEYFNVTKYAIQLSRKVRAKTGIFSKPSPYLGRSLERDVQDREKLFYCDDETSRQMPGIKDTISIRRGDSVQKRLLLANLRELYENFKKGNPEMKIGFSIFCSLRPKFCIMAGPSGTHNVCVYTINQNIKLKLHALGLKVKLSEIIPDLVCKDASRECMLQICNKCPSNEVITDLLTDRVKSAQMNNEDFDVSEFLKQDVQFSSWTTVDRAELLTQVTTMEELISVTSSSLKKAVTHDFVAGKQAAFLKELKQSLLENQAIIMMDFTMNYSCLLQDAIQSYHWSRRQVTVHPVVILYKETGVLKYKNLCFISDDLEHDVNLVQKFLEKTILYLSSNLSFINDITYVSDGCGQQYKNFKNFIFLCRHEEMFNIKASWFFFATSHGKSVCDALSGLIKRLAVRASLQRPLENQIVNAEKLFEFCCSSALKESISFFFVSKLEVDEKRENQKKCVALPIPGTRSFHHFFPLSGSIVGCKRVSSDTDFSYIHQICEPKEQEIWQESCFVAVMVESKIFVSYITDINYNEQEADLILLHPPLPSATFTWEDDVLTYTAPFPDILTKVPLKEGADKTYQMPTKEVLRIRQLATLRKKRNKQ